jgi:hypothetical protein
MLTTTDTGGGSNGATLAMRHTKPHRWTLEHASVWCADHQDRSETMRRAEAAGAGVSTSGIVARSYDV